MTYKEFKEQGYTIEALEHATVYSEVTINESGIYDFKQVDLDVGEPMLYRIISNDSNDEHAYEEFSDMEDVQDYIKNEM